MSIEKNKVTIYTDGGCEPNPGVGGWGAILSSATRSKELSGGELETTNNRMEMTAAIEALRALKRPCTVDLHTDSEYLQKGITQWIPKWKRKNWKKGDGKPVKNVDLWQALDIEIAKHKVRWHWLKGHAGHHYNERCDELASEAIARMKYGNEP